MRRKISSLKFLLKKIYKTTTFGDSSNFRDVDIAKYKKYIDKLHKKYMNILNDDNNPKSYLFRSYLQYRCQKYGLSLLNNFFINLISIFGIVVFLISFPILNILYFRTEKDKIFNQSKKKAVALYMVKKSLIPFSVLSKYKIFFQNYWIFFVDKFDIFFILTLLKYFYYEPNFILKNIIKITYYSAICNKYRPSAVIVSSEYSFTSSVLSLYLLKKGIEHINIMHGEKLYNIRDSFFRFSKCYVWDEHYIQLFKKLFAYENQFEVSLNPHHEKLIKAKKYIVKENIIKFYWASEKNTDELKYIKNRLNKLKQKGFKVIIRYHPLHKEYFNKNILIYFNNFIIEDPNSIDIYNSLFETNYVLASYSTVLLEANMMGRIVVINDYNKNIQKLEKLEYILIKKGNFIPFSELVNKKI